MPPHIRPTDETEKSQTPESSSPVRSLTPVPITREAIDEIRRRITQITDPSSVGEEEFNALRESTERQLRAVGYVSVELCSISTVRGFCKLYEDSSDNKEPFPFHVYMDLCALRDALEMKLDKVGMDDPDASWR